MSFKNRRRYLLVSEEWWYHEQSNKIAYMREDIIGQYLCSLFIWLAKSDLQKLKVKCTVE